MKRYAFKKPMWYSYFVSSYVCDSSYFHVVLCPSSSQILATSLVIHPFPGVTQSKHAIYRLQYATLCGKT